MRTDALTISSGSEDSLLPGNGSVGLMMQQVLTDLGWEDLRPAIYAAEQVDREIAAELAAAHQAYLDESEPSQHRRLQRALDQAIGALQADYQYVRNLQMQAEERLAKSRITEASSSYISLLGGWVYSNLQQIFDSDDATLVKRYSNIAQSRRESLTVLKCYHDSLEETEAKLESEVEINSKSVERFTPETFSPQTRVRRLLTVDSGEFRVNTYITNGQGGRPSLAALNDSGFVIAWESYGQDGSDSGVYAQRYNPGGSPLGGEFQVNTYVTNGQGRPSLAALKDGGFVIAWESYRQDGSDSGVYAQRYNLGGSLSGGEFQVNTHVTNGQGNPSLAALNDGGFVIAWESYGQDGSDSGVYAQRYNPGGSPLGGEFQVNTYVTNGQGNPSLAALNDGGFVIAWESYGQDGSDSGVYAQRYNPGGSPLGGEFQVNTYVTNGQGRPSLAALKDGGFVIAWESYRQDGSDSGVYAQRYNLGGSLSGGEFQVNTHVINGQGNPSLAALNDGGFVIAWESYGQDGSDSGVYSRLFSNIPALTPTLTPTVIPATLVPITTPIPTSLLDDSSSSSSSAISLSASEDSGSNSRHAMGSSTGISSSRISSTGLSLFSSSSSSGRGSFNRPPYLRRSISPQIFETQRPFRFDIEPDTFIDPDDDPLTWSAELADHSVLPEGLNFAASSQTFTGVLTDSGRWNVSIMVSDAEGLSAQGFFNLQLVSIKAQVDVKTWASVASVLATLLITVGGYCWRRSKLSSERRQYPLASDLRDQLKLSYHDLQRGQGRIYADWIRDMSTNVSTTLHLDPRIGRVMREHHLKGYRRYVGWFHEAIQQERIVLPTTVCGVMTRGCCKSYNLPINELGQHRQNIEMKVVNDALSYYDENPGVDASMRALNHYAFMNRPEAVPDGDMELVELKGQGNPVRIARAEL